MRKSLVNDTGAVTEGVYFGIIEALSGFQEGRFDKSWYGLAFCPCNSLGKFGINIFVVEIGAIVNTDGFGNILFERSCEYKLSSFIRHPGGVVKGKGADTAFAVSFTFSEGRKVRGGLIIVVLRIVVHNSVRIIRLGRKVKGWGGNIFGYGDLP